MEGATTNVTTTLVKTVKNGSDILEYSYDEMGNIQNVSKNGNVIESYTYDALGQLKTVTRGTDVYEYTYDNGGNILSEKKNGTVSKTYTYGDNEWKDLLTAYNGETITYDNIGNPLTYRNDMTFSWADGRKLANITKGMDSIAYTYGADGLRGSKTVNGTTTDYYYLNGTLYGQRTGSEYILFLYDENGSAYGFVIKSETSENTYYYEFNVQGDVIGIIDSTGTRVVEYAYDAWGNILSVTGTLAESIGQKNPLRYRGYYYDAETGFYYLQSRYYDPENCRFINADSQINLNGFVDHNMFAYCCNNPVTCSDHDGRDQEYELYSTQKQLRVGNVRIVVSTTFYLIVPDGMPYTIALSKSEFSVGGSLSHFDVAYAKGHSGDKGGYTLSLTLYNDETHSMAINLDGSASLTISAGDYNSVEFNVQVYWEDDETSPPWALQPQEEKSFWGSIRETLSENMNIIIIGGGTAGVCLVASAIFRVGPQKYASHRYA